MYSKTKNLLLAMLMLVTVGSVIFLSSCSEDDPIVAPTISYSDATVAVGVGGTVAPTTGGDEATFTILDAGDAETFVTINTTTGELTVADESTTGTYEVKVKATNSAGAVEAIAKITVGLNPAGFNPTGKTLYWKYWMNHTANIVMKNLNTLPGLGSLPAEIPLPTGWPAGWPAINPADPALPSYFVFSGVQGALMEVPGDEACAPQKGDTLLVIVNSDLTLSTKCRNANNTTGATVEIGTSSISFAGGKYAWSLNTSLQGIPVVFQIDDVKIANFTDPLDPDFNNPSGTPRTFPAIQGNVAQYITPTDFASPLTSIKYLNVDVVLEVLN